MSWAVAPAARRWDGTPAVPALLLDRGAVSGRRPGGGLGDETRSARGRLTEYGLDAEASSQVLPTPAGPPPRRRRDRRTPRPRRAPCLTAPSLTEGSPPL